MKATLNFFLLFITMTVQIPAQQTPATAWGKQYGFPREDMRVAADELGNCFVGGTSTDSLSISFAGGRDVFLRKFDEQGSTLWTINFGSDKDDYCSSMVSDAEGNCYIAGKTNGNIDGTNLGSNDAFIAKISSSGSVLWKHQFGTDKADDLQIVTLDKEGNCIAAGSTAGSFKGTNAGAADAIFIKLSSAGNLIWEKQYGTNSSEAAQYLCFDKNKTGYAILSSKVILQFTESGDFSLKFTHPIHEAKGIAVDDSLNIFIGGYQGLNNGSQAMLLKYNKDAVKQWEKRFGSGPWTGINSMHQIPDGSCDLLLGVCQSYPTCSAVVRRYDPQGNVKWVYTLKNNVNSVCGHYTAIGSTGNYYITGSTDGNLFATKVKSTEYFLSKVTLTGQTDVKSDINESISIELEQNFPNPFNPSTKVNYYIPIDSPVSLSIFSVDGKLVKTLINKFQSSGRYSIIWDGKDNKGVTLSSGVYIYRLEANNATFQKKMVLLR